MKFVKRNLKFFITFGVLVVLMIIGTFLDLQISHAIAEVPEGKYYSKNVFAVFFECLGEMPVYILPAIAFACLFFYLKKVSTLKKSSKIILMVLCVICAIALGYVGSHKLLKYFSIHVSELKLNGIVKYICEAFLGVAFTALWFFIGSLVNPKNLKSAAICSLIVISTAILSQLIAQELKPIFGRARYRLMNLTGDFSEYTRWYQVNIGKKVSLAQLTLGAESDGYKSFPSGHTTAAGVVFALMSIPYLFKGVTKRDHYLINAACMLYVGIVAFSRIVMGAHYLTDVTMGALIVFASYAISNFAVPAIIKKLKKSAANK